MHCILLFVTHCKTDHDIQISKMENTAVQVGSHESWVEGQNPIPRPPVHSPLEAVQDRTGILGCEHIPPAYVQLLVYQHTQFFLLRADHSSFCTQPVFVLGIALTQVQNLSLGLVELLEDHTDSLPQPLQVPLDLSLPSSLLTAPHSLLSSENLLRGPQSRCSCSQKNTYVNIWIFHINKRHIQRIVGVMSQVPFVSNWNAFVTGSIICLVTSVEWMNCHCQTAACQMRNLMFQLSQIYNNARKCSYYGNNFSLSKYGKV